MGTRCLTVVKDEDGKECLVMYRQMDGYPDGHGRELEEFLKGKKMVNGIGMNPKNIFNGMGCLAGQIVSHFKGEVAGNFYLYPSGTRDVGEEYVYIVTAKEGEEAKVKVERG